MTSDLPALLAKVEALTGPDREVDLAIGNWLWEQGSYKPWECFDYTRYGDGNIPFTASIDAALALVEMRLPDDAEDVISEALAAVEHRGWTASEFAIRFVQEILVALLSALISKGEQHGPG